MRRIANVLMLDTVTSAATSSVYTNNLCDACSIQISGTFTSAVVYVQGKLNPDIDDWVNIAVIDLSNYTVDSDGISNKKLYEVGIDGVQFVRINAATVTGGNLSAYVSFFDTSAQ